MRTKIPKKRSQVKFNVLVSSQLFLRGDAQKAKQLTDRFRKIPRPNTKTDVTNKSKKGKTGRVFYRKQTFVEHHRFKTLISEISMTTERTTVRATRQNRHFPWSVIFLHDPGIVRRKTTLRERFVALVISDGPTQYQSIARRLGRDSVKQQAVAALLRRHPVSPSGNLERSCVYVCAQLSTTQ